ncbi:MAG: hypothetical protein CSA81_10700 [Acidobacteria bacterium]|nr:MAG: hypothetical protein CSA81_10700 [Acidobacteriota bacterium]
MRMVMVVLFGVTALCSAGDLTHTELKKQMQVMAGAPGPFAAHENFPKDYFLISKNIPFYVGLTLHHPSSELLKLTDEQLTRIQEIRARVMPVVVTSAIKIKKMEIALADKIVHGAKAEVLLSDVEEIARLKTALTMEHLRCIEAVRAVLTQQQEKILLSYAAEKPH